MLVCKDIADKVFQILNENGHRPEGISIHLFVTREDFNKVHVEDADRFSESQIEAHKKTGDIGWSCILVPDDDKPFEKMPSTEDIHLKSLLENLTIGLESHFAPVQSCQIDWILKERDFDEKFTDHPNLIEGSGIQVSDYINKTYCSIQILRQISLRL